jgi:hypothetical protein
MCFLYKAAASVESKNEWLQALVGSVKSSKRCTLSNMRRPLAKKKKKKLIRNILVLKRKSHESGTIQHATSDHAVRRLSRRRASSFDADGARPPPPPLLALSAASPPVSPRVDHYVCVVLVCVVLFRWVRVHV